jgi:hypothetical protein
MSSPSQEYLLSVGWQSEFSLEKKAYSAPPAQQPSAPAVKQPKAPVVKTEVPTVQPAKAPDPSKPIASNITNVRGPRTPSTPAPRPAGDSVALTSNKPSVKPPKEVAGLIGNMKLPTGGSNTPAAGILQGFAQGKKGISLDQARTVAMQGLQRGNLKLVAPDPAMQRGQQGNQQANLLNQRRVFDANFANNQQQGMVRTASAKEKKASKLRAAGEGIALGTLAGLGSFGLLKLHNWEKKHWAKKRAAKRKKAKAKTASTRWSSKFGHAPLIDWAQAHFEKLSTQNWAAPPPQKVPAPLPPAPAVPTGTGTKGSAPKPQQRIATVIKNKTTTPAGSPGSVSGNPANTLAQRQGSLT